MSIARSLSKDGADITALHSPKWRQELDAPVKSLGEQVPFFYTRAGAVLPLEGMYRGGHAFLMANGPSVSALDLSPLHRRWVMTLNNGARTFRGNANCTVDEPSRFSLSMWQELDARGGPIASQASALPGWHDEGTGAPRRAGREKRHEEIRLCAVLRTTHRSKLMRTIKIAIIALTLFNPSISGHAAVPGGEALAGVIMDEFDTNTDAKLDQGEWQGGIGDSFASLDGNGDGSIAADEVDGIKGDLASKTGDLTAGVLVLIVKQVVLSLDSDKDKLVSKKEYDALSNDVFEKLDSDKDKSLTSAELAELPVKLIVQ